MNILPRFSHIVAPALVLLLLPAQGPDYRDGDPPSRVARLSYISGSVSFRPGDVNDWTDATVNYPLRNGDHLWTDSDARAEISLGSTVIRLDQWTAFAFLALDDRTAQIDLSEGSIDVRVRRLDERGLFEIDTPNGAVTLERPGTYRVDVDSSGDTTIVTVRGGAAEVTASGSAFSVEAGEVGVLSGRDAPSYDITDASPPDNWERWSASRDRRWDDSRSTRYVSPDMVGYEDLDDYGDWRDGGSYGPLWVPRDVDAGWAPYRYGHWAWVEPWGWTWVDDAPWGFAPFHYGRWVWFSDRWAWVPGRVVARPVYAPALVAFVGGPNWSVSLAAGGAGGVAWFPLGPDEVYVPAYRVSPTYVRNVNVTNVNVTNINVTNIDVTRVRYRNREVDGAVTSVSEENFVGARPVGRNAVIVPRERMREAVVVGSAAPLAPTRVSVLAQPGPMRVRRPPETVVERQVVVKTPPPPAPVPFSVKEPVLRRQPGRPLDQEDRARLRESLGNDVPRNAVRPAVPPSGTAPELRPVRGGLPAPHQPPPSGVVVPNPQPPSSNAPPAAQTQPSPPRRRGPPPREESNPPSPAVNPPVNATPDNGSTGQPPRHEDRGKDRRAPPPDTAAPRGQSQPPAANAPANAPPRNEPGPPSRREDRGRDRRPPPDTAAPRGQPRPDRDKIRPDTTKQNVKPKSRPRRGEHNDSTKEKPHDNP
ncbi:MAG TPA: DUF6600 domain-containing protein [Gemmatimonadales bacterium]|nr:DUF6600 domain-containing protein [Gemmatimonadales bacterium]